MSAPSGLGEGARCILRALEAGGYAPSAIDLTPDIQPERAVLPVPDAAPDDGFGPLIVHVNPPELPRALLALRQAGIGRRRLIGYWAWELPQPPASWRPATELVHVVWAPSGYTASAFSNAWSVSAHAVGYALSRPPVDPAHMTAWRKEADADAPGRFLVVAAADIRSSLVRKNIAGAVEAFRRAFGEDPKARLLIKLTGAGRGHAVDLDALRQGAPHVHVVMRETPQSEAAALWAAADVVLSPHRAEGFGLTLAEAMLAGTPVIMTGWSGNVEFGACPGAFLIPARLGAVEDAAGVYPPESIWAEPDLGAAAEALRAIRAFSPDQRETLSQRSRAYMAHALSPGRFLARMDAQTRAAMRLEGVDL